jgi:hypothetical protein
LEHGDANSALAKERGAVRESAPMGCGLKRVRPGQETVMYVLPRCC